MSRRFKITLEYDGDDPIRNTFLCAIDDLDCSVLRDYDGMYYIDSTYSGKEESLQTSEMRDFFAPCTSGTKEIAEKIESIKKEMESAVESGIESDSDDEWDIELAKQHKEFMNDVIYDLQRMHDIAIEKCKEHNISPENLYIKWWTDC